MARPDPRAATGGMSDVVASNPNPDRPPEATPVVHPAAEGRLGSLAADWLPIALLIGDAIIAALSVPAVSWQTYHYALQSLPFGPSVAAIHTDSVDYVHRLR